MVDEAVAGVDRGKAHEEKEFQEDHEDYVVLH